LHEPKGVENALLGQVYIADGSNSGVWEFPSGFAYGELFISEGVTSQTLPASSATAKLNPTAEWTTNGNANVTLNAGSGTITILQAGEYSLNFYITFNTAAIASSAIYNFHYAKNGVHDTRKALVKKVSNGVDMLHCSASGIASFAQNDVISMYVGGDATSSSTAITPIESGFNCILVQPAL